MKKSFRQKNGLYFNKKDIKEADDQRGEGFFDNLNFHRQIELQIISARYNDYYAVRKLIKWLRAEVVRSAELAFSKDRESFKLLRSRLLGLFGEAWGAEKQLKDLFDDEQQHQNGQARSDFENCKKGDVHD